MRKKTVKHEVFTRRAVIFTGAKMLAMSTLMGRLYYLQFIQADEYKTLSESNRVKLQLIPPVRGTILDRNGLPLAINEKNYRLLLERDKPAVIQDILRQLEPVITLGPERQKQIMSDAKQSRFAPPILVKDHLSWEELSRVEFFSAHLPGMMIDAGQIRYYPLEDKASHLIGYIGAVAEDELTDQPLLRLPDFKIGKNGVEKGWEDQLRGQAGIKHVEVNVHSLPVRELAIKPSIPGEALHLTIDRRLQEFASNRIAGESAAAVVMDVNNGNILALVSMPGFDPNSFSKGISSVYWKELNDNIRNPLLNKAITGQYPPGSTFKMMVGLAALQEEVATPDTHVFCPGHFFLGNHRFNCWRKEGHGSVNLEYAIAESCDTYFYTMAQRLGISKIAEMSRRFGLGEIHDIGISGEKPGLIPDEKWKRKRYKQPWQTGDTVNAGIGQGYVLSTPLQLAVMAARLANGGLEVKPRLVDDGPVDPPSMGLDPEILRHVQQGMISVTTAPFGTAYGKRIMNPDMAMAGKTGTSQIKRIIKRGMNPEDMPWEDRHHALFVGYAPISNPRYAVAVLIEHGGGGSSAAAPVARDILLKIQMLEKEDAQKKEETPKEGPAT